MINTEMVLLMIAGLAAFAFWGSMAVHCLKNRELSTEERLLWALAIVFGKLVGAGAYYFLRYRQRASMTALC